jgi:hypothetical protein
MCKIEDLLYEAHHEGIRDDVLSEGLRLYELGGKFKSMKTLKRLEIALKNVRDKKRNDRRSTT